MRKYVTWRCTCLHVAATFGLLTCVAFGQWQFRSTSSTTMGVGYALAWVVFGIYILYLWWKLIHQKHVPFDKDWAVKAREKAEAAGIPLNEIPGWAMDKSLRKAVNAANSERREALALSFGRRAQVEKSIDQGVTLAKTSTSEIAESSVVDWSDVDDPPDDLASSNGNDDEADRVIPVRAISSTVISDEELDAYNRYLAELSRSDPPKRWRRSREPRSRE
jgi:hypothetical protein